MSTILTLYDKKDEYNPSTSLQRINELRNLNSTLSGRSISLYLINKELNMIDSREFLEESIKERFNLDNITSDIYNISFNKFNSFDKFNINLIIEEDDDPMLNLVGKNSLSMISFLKDSYSNQIKYKYIQPGKKGPYKIEL